MPLTGAALAALLFPLQPIFFVKPKREKKNERFEEICCLL